MGYHKQIDGSHFVFREKLNVISSSQVELLEDRRFLNYL